jgi:hypothetical protein
LKKDFYFYFENKLKQVQLKGEEKIQSLTKNDRAKEQNQASNNLSHPSPRIKTIASPDHPVLTTLTEVVVRGLD